MDLVCLRRFQAASGRVAETGGRRAGPVAVSRAGQNSYGHAGGSQPARPFPEKSPLVRQPGRAPADSSNSAGVSAPPIFAGHDKLWICLGDQVKCLDQATGSVKQTIPITGRFVSFTPADTSLLVVSAPDETRRIALRIELATGAVSSQEITVPRKEKQTLPDDLPPNVLPTAAVLTSQILEEQKFNKPLDAMSSEFFSAGKNLVELRVKLLQAKVSYVQSIKPSGPSQLNGQTTAGSSAGPIAEDIFNDLKRSQTGGVRPVDESLYEVRLRRWIEAQPVEWRGEVTGAPSFFPLSTVDLLVGGPESGRLRQTEQQALRQQTQLPGQRTLHHRRSGRPPHAGGGTAPTPSISLIRAF